MAEPLLITATYTCPSCKAVMRDHGHENAVFARQKCPRCGAGMAATFHHTVIAEDGKSASMVPRLDHGVR